MRRRIFTTVAGAVALASLTFDILMVSAQQPQGVRIRGTIEKIDGNVLTAKSREGGDVKITLTGDNVGEFLGVQKFRDSAVHERSEVGIVTGLAWTEAGAARLRPARLDPRRDRP